MGRALKDNESISIHAYEPHQAPTDEQLQASVEALRAHFSAVDDAAEAIPEQELDEVIDEALRSVRSGYRPVR